jgi:uncharacterized repeat protein (TIGR01451 family)
MRITRTGHLTTSSRIHRIFGSQGRLTLPIAATLALILFLSSTGAQAATINVPFDQATIQAAVNAANPGDEIVVADGTYSESVDLNLMNSIGHITIRSATINGATVDGGAAPAFTAASFAGNITIRDFSLDRDSDSGSTASAGRNGLLQFHDIDGVVSIVNNDFVTGYGSRGISLTSDSDGLLTHALILDNEFISPADNADAISIRPGHREDNATAFNSARMSVVIDGNVFTGLQDDAILFGAETEGTITARVTNNTVSGQLGSGTAIEPKVGNGTFGSGAGSVAPENTQGFYYIAGNNITNAEGDGIRPDIDGRGTSTRMIITGNTITVPDDDGIYVDSDSSSDGNTAHLLLDNNIITTAGEDGINLRPFSSGSTTQVWNVVLANNSLNDTSNDGTSTGGAYFIDADSSSSNYILNVDLRSNDSTATNSFPAYGFDQANGSTVNLDQGTSSAFDVPSVMGDNLNTGTPLFVSGTVNVVADAVDDASIPGTIQGSVFHDSNLDGLSTGEATLPLVLVSLSGTETATSATVNLSVVTDDDGFYMFPAVLPGAYTITVTPTAALPVFTMQDVGADDTIDSDVDQATGTFVLADTVFTEGNQVFDIDAGLTPPQPVDIQVSKTESIDPVIAGSGIGNVVHTVTMANNGPGFATGLSVSEIVTIPAGVSIDLITPSSGTYTGGANGTWNIGSMAPMASETLTIVMTVSPMAAVGVDVISDTATVVSLDQMDTNGGNNSATETTSIGRVVDLTVGKTESIDPVVAGSGPGNLVYVVSVTNNGPSAASGVMVAEDLTLPAGVSRDSVVPSAGIFADVVAPDGIWTLDLLSGATATLTISLTVGDTTATGVDVISDTATVTGTGGGETLINNGDDSATEATSVTAESDLTITKIDDQDPVDAGMPLQYTIEVTNNGPSDATDVVVNDVLPAGVVFDTTSGCGGDPDGVPDCSLGTVAVGATVSYTIDTTVDGATAGEITNSATVTAGSTLINTADDTATETTDVTALAGFSTTLTGSVDPVFAGTVLTYTVDLSNTGPGDGENVEIFNVLPDGALYASDTGGCAQPGTLVGQRAQLAGANVVPAVTSTASAEAVAVIDTVAEVLTFGVHLEGLAGGNTVIAAHIHLGSTGTNGPVVHTLYAGTPVFDNTTPITGAVQLTTQEMNDLMSLDHYVQVHTVVNPGGEIRAQLVMTAEEPLFCSVGDISIGAATAFDVVVNVPADSGDGSQLTSTSLVQSSTKDPGLVTLPAPNGTGELKGATARMETTVGTEADLGISKIDSVDPVIAGDSLVYTIRVDNNGPSDAQDVVVTDLLPAGVTLVSTSGCAEDPAGVPVCSLGTIAAGGFSEYTINVAVNPSAPAVITNTATVTSSTTEGNPGDEIATEDTTVTAVADLSISKTDSVDPVIAGTGLVYTVRVDNAGPSDATSVVVTDSLPAGVTFVSTTGCAEDPLGAPTCNLGTIAAGGFRTYTLTVDVDPTARGVITNNASLTSAATDLVPANNSTSESTTVNAEVDLTLVKTDSEDPLPSGNDLVYTLSVTNHGPSSATGVVVTDILPAGVTLVGTAGCAEDPVGVPTCTLGAINSGASAQYTITVSIDPAPPASITNTASVTSIEPEVDPSDNTDDEETILDNIPPEVVLVNSVGDTGDGEVEECESVLVVIDTLLVTFSEDVRDPVGDTDPDDVTNPFNYLVLATGPDGDFSTDSCGSVFADDIEIPVNSVTYDSSSHVSRLHVGGMPPSQIRLIICGSTSIRDLAGNALDGDGDGTGGDDHLLTFRYDPMNLFTNGHFDCPSVGLVGWDVSNTSEIAYSGDDADFSPISGSVQVMQLGSNTNFGLSQCVPPSVGPNSEMAAKVRMSTTSFVSLSIGCEYFSGTACGAPGTGFGTSVSTDLIFDSAGSWLSYVAEPDTPAGAGSALCSFSIAAPSGQDFTAWLDDLFLDNGSLVFSDGFESGDTSAWAVSVP